MESEVHIIQDVLEQWRKFTTDEAQAIRCAQWQTLLTSQEAKRGLREQIDAACRKLEKAGSGGAEWEAVRRTARALLEQERRNERALAEQKRAAECTSRQSENALRQLHQ